MGEKALKPAVNGNILFLPGNLPPQFLSTNQYYALSQEDLELGIDVSDPEGMPVTLTLTDGSPTKAVMRGNILL